MKTQLKLCVCTGRTSQLDILPLLLQLLLTGTGLTPNKHRKTILWKRFPHESAPPQFFLVPDATDFAKGNDITSTLPKAPIDPCPSPTLPQKGLDRPAGEIPRSSQNLGISSHQVASTGSSSESAAFIQSLDSHKEDSKSQDFGAFSVEPRRFHLSKNALSRFVPYPRPGHGVQEERRSRRADVAVFEEKGQRAFWTLKRNDSQASANQDRQSNDEKQAPKCQSESLQKRPNASPAERQWRKENWGQSGATAHSGGAIQKTAQSIDGPSNQPEHISEDLAEQLYAFAMEQTRAPEQQAQHSRSPREPKVKPKPPKSRQSSKKPPGNDDAMDTALDDAASSVDEKDFVFDTYIRTFAPSSEPAGSHDADVDPLKGIDGGKVGILVIEDGEEAVWEAFGEDQSTDEEGNTDDEDENGQYGSRN